MAFLIPVGRDVIIHPIERPSKIGMIHVPDSVRRRVNQGIVIAKGKDCKFDEIETSDHVMFNGYTGDKITLVDGGIFYAVPEQFIVGKVKNSNVVLMDTETVKRIITERLGEITGIEGIEGITISTLIELEKDLLERIDSITIAEGFEF